MPSAKKPAFDPQSFLDLTGVTRKVKRLRKNEIIFSQGDRGHTVLYLEKGNVALSVVSHSGKEAVVAMLGPGDFFGEWCLADQPVRIATAKTIAPSTVYVIEKQEMLRALHAKHELCDRFISYMISRSIRIEQDLIDQLFSPTEKRLARLLLRLARYGRQHHPETTLPRVTQQMLADMVGSTRSRISFFMNKFRRLGLIDYDGELKIHRSLLNVVVRDPPASRPTIAGRRRSDANLVRRKRSFG